MESAALAQSRILPSKLLAQSAWAVEYTDSASAERYDPHNEYPGYDTKQSGPEW